MGILLLDKKEYIMTKNNIYEIVEFKNGIKMMALLPINNTGVAEAYITIRSNPVGFSKGKSYGDLNCGGLYKKLGMESGIADFKLCCEALGISDRSVITNRLTYFTNVVRDVNKSSLKGYDIYDEPSAPHADGLITNDPDITLFNYAADCSIIMFASPKYKIVGTLHAAWKGSLAGIIESEVEQFKKKTESDISDLIAVVCPCISQEKFEVGENVAQKFIEAHFEQYVDYESYEMPHVSLSGVNKEILLKCGLKPNNIFVIDDLCTVKNAELFHSYRRGPVDINAATGKEIHQNGQNGYFIKLI